MQFYLPFLSDILIGFDIQVRGFSFVFFVFPCCPMLKNGENEGEKWSERREGENGVREERGNRGNK